MFGDDASDNYTLLYALEKQLLFEDAFHDQIFFWYCCSIACKIWKALDRSADLPGKLSYYRKQNKTKDKLWAWAYLFKNN